MATLIPCLDELRDEFDDLSAGRDRASDGWIGDRAHAQTSSDHNDDESGRVPIRDADSKPEVHAVDVDKDLRRSGVTMAAIVAFVIARCRAGLEKRLRYVIFNRTIWSESTGWQARAYTGSNPHDKHAHFSGSYDSAREADRRPWGVANFGEDTMDKADVKAALLEAVKDPAFRSVIVEASRTRQPYVSDAVRKYATEDPRGPGNTVDLSDRLMGEYTYQQAHLIHNSDVPALRDALTQALATLTELAGRDLTDEAAIADLVLAGLGARDLDVAVSALRAAFGDRFPALVAALVAAQD